MPRHLSYVVLALLCLHSVASAQDTAQAPQPNVLLVLVDDLGWQDLGASLQSASAPVNGHFRTPNLERLAAYATRFTQAYAAAPVCTPTRTSLMTGRSPGQTHNTYWILHKDKDQSARFDGLLPPAWNVNGLQPDDVTLAALLNDAGYRTIHVGKAHLGAKGTPGEDPCNLGFDVNVAGHGAGGPGSFLGAQDFSAAHRGGGHMWDVPGLEEYHGKDIFLTEALAERAVQEVEDAVKSEEPFFLHFAPYAVHAPITANEKYLEHYADLDPREAAYATMVETVDAALGQLLDSLEALEVLDNTLVIYTSDNGGLSAHGRGGAAHGHNAPLRSGKGSAYEGGVRVPLFVAWPADVRSSKPLRSCATPVITMDLFPTVLAAVGLGLPSPDDLEGIDLAPMALGQPAPERALCWNQPHFWGVAGPGIFPYSALRSGSWKLIYRHLDRKFELYDLEHDLGEVRDLASKQPEVVRRLARQLDSWIEERGVQLSLDSETGEPIPSPLNAIP